MNESSSNPVVSVVIPAYGRAEKLRRAVRSVLAQDMEPDGYEVIVVDSTPDESNERVVESLQESARCVLRCVRKKAEGPGPSRNRGVQEARGRIIAFMDSDCEAAPEWLREGVAAFEEGVGLVQGRTIPEPGVPHSAFNYTIEVVKESFLYETANIFYRKAVFEQLGGFLPDLLPNADRPVGGEDVDLAWRAKRGGWESRFAEKATVMHEVVRLTPMRWLFNPRLYIIPRAVHKYPELRRFFYARYFLEEAHAWLVFALAGVALTPVSPFALLLGVPYLVKRGSERSLTLRGPKQWIRPLVYIPRDLASLSLLVAGSIRHRALLL